MTQFHTPGPWEAVDRLTVRSAYSMGDKSAAGWEVARLPESALPGDAALIAAAPDLLAAAHLGLELALGLDGMSRNNAEALADEYAARIRAAIAKAEGRK